MMNQTENQDKDKPKGFFARLMDKMDKKLKDASEKKGCCCGTKSEEKGSSCC